MNNEELNNEDLNNEELNTEEFDVDSAQESVNEVSQDTLQFINLDDFDLDEEDILAIQEKEDKDKNKKAVEKKTKESATKQERSADGMENDGENKSFMKKVLEGLPRMLCYFAVFAVVIVFWELILRYKISHSVSAKNLFFLAFIPAEAMVLTVFAGLFRNKTVNKIVFTLLLLLTSVYYMVQAVYFRNFGSLLSISMAGMGGDAVGDFGWAVTDSIRDSVKVLVAVLFPALVLGVFVFVKKEICKGYHWSLHILGLLMIAGLWAFGLLGLKIGGTDRQSAYYAYHNSLADTDTTANRLGAMTTSILESGSYFFGIKTGDSNDALASIDESALTMMPVTEAEPVVAEPVVSDNVATEEEPEEVEEPFVSVPYVYDEIDFTALKELATDKDTQALCDYFAAKTPTGTNEYTGMFEGYNLIYICAESFWSYACDPDVTPTLYKMKNSGIVLNNYYNSFKNTTTNGEYAFSTSLWPDVSRDASCGTAVGSFAQSVSKYMPFGMGTMYANAGYNTYGYHNFEGHYYRRSYSWPNLGYENLKFMGQGMHFTTSWPSSDLEMMEQSVDDYINDDHFLTYYMTFSGHGPFSSANVMYNKNIAEVKERLGDREYTDNALGYFAGELELDKAMEYLLNRLEEAGKLDNTVIVLTGDHYPYYLTQSGRDSLVGYAPDESFEIYKSTCMIYNAGMETFDVDTYCCNVDIVPTMYNLFGINYDSRLLMGTDIFSEGNHKAQLYNQSFITDMVKYNAETGQEEWLVDDSLYSDEIKSSYLDAQIASSEGSYAAATKLLANNFYLFVFKNSGLLSGADLTAEIDRENSAEQRASEELLQEQITNGITTWSTLAANLGGSIDAATCNIVDGNGNVLLSASEIYSATGVLPEVLIPQIQANLALQAQQALLLQQAQEAAAQQAQPQ